MLVLICLASFLPVLTSQHSERTKVDSLRSMAIEYFLDHPYLTLDTEAATLLFPEQGGCNADAIRRRCGGTGKICRRREKICKRPGGVALSPGLNCPRPGDNHRCADSALIHVAFSAPQ